MATINNFEIATCEDVKKNIKIQITKKTFLLNGCIQPVYIYHNLTDSSEIVTYYTNGGDLHYYPVVSDYTLWNCIRKNYPELIPKSQELFEVLHS